MLDELMNMRSPARSQTGLIDGNMGGQMIGILLSGWAVDKYGYKIVFQLGLLSVIGFTFITFFSNGNLGIYAAGLILSGIPWGMFQAIAPSYACDLC